jgi:hypothetical protein
LNFITFGTIPLFAFALSCKKKELQEERREKDDDESSEVYQGSDAIRKPEEGGGWSVCGKRAGDRLDGFD